MVPFFNFSTPLLVHFITKKRKKFPKCNCKKEGSPQPLQPHSSIIMKVRARRLYIKFFTLVTVATLQHDLKIRRLDVATR